MGLRALREKGWRASDEDVNILLLAAVIVVADRAEQRRSLFVSYLQAAVNTGSCEWF